MNTRFKVNFCFLLLFLAGCNSTPSKEALITKKSALSKERLTSSLILDASSASSEKRNTESASPERTAEDVRFIPPYKLSITTKEYADDLLSQFSENKDLKITANGLALSDFLHQVLGDMLSVSYIISDEVKSDAIPVTLNIQSDISQKKLFTVTEGILQERNYVIRYSDGIFYIHKNEGATSQGNFVYGYGKRKDDVPQTSSEIIQIIRFEYGLQPSLPNTMRVMLGIKAQVDLQKGVVTLQGKRDDIIKGIDLINMLDQPNVANQHIAPFKVTYSSTGEIIKKLIELFAQEGIVFSEGRNDTAAIRVTQVDSQGLLIFFASNNALIERAVFWAKKIDLPVNIPEKQYFIYQPSYSRASDLGSSLEALISDTPVTTSSTSVNQESSRLNNGGYSARTASSEQMKMVVDARANSLIFFTSGEAYQQILPLIKRLDVQPKQVMLEVVIAEVSLTNEFKQGVEFAFKNGSYGFSTLGAFMGEGFGGMSYLLKGPQGQLALNLLQTNSLVNILSRPSLVVRDGVNANITVGTDIPIIGQTTADPINGDRQTTQIEYRKTGVDLSVKPTVNARGIIVMEIKQKISNEVETGSTLAGNPSVFERTISTEVIAESGQTIILGGLISENQSNKSTRVPFFSNIPIIGTLFKAEAESGDKTELVVLVTPRVIESVEQWSEIKHSIEASLNNIKIN